MARAGGTLALGMVVTLASVVYAAFRAGSNTALFTLDASEDGDGPGQVGARACHTHTRRGCAVRRLGPLQWSGFDAQDGGECGTGASKPAGTRLAL